MTEFSKDVLKRDVIDRTIDDFIVKNGLVGKIPLTVELQRIRR